MKTKTKKILFTICAMFLSVFMFAGCNLIEVNKYKYYSQKVVTIGLKDGYGEEYKSYERVYTKKDLMTAYYNYAYNYVSQGQIGVEEGVDYAINNMINSDLLYNYIKINYFENNNYDLEFTKEDANDVKLEAFDSMQDSIYALEKEIFEEWDVEYLNEDELSDEQTTSLRATYEEYTSKLEYIKDYKFKGYRLALDGESGEYTFDANTGKYTYDPVNGTYVMDYSDAVILKDNNSRVHDERTAPEHFVQAIRHEEVSKEAYVRYVKQLQDAAKAEGLSTDETTVLHNEEKRLIDLYTRSKYMTIFEEWYNKYYNFTFDGENYVLNDDILTQVVDTYKQEYESQALLYADNKDKYHEAMGGDDISKVYYHHDNEYVYISHILLKFSDAQIEEIKALDKKLEKKLISQSRYDELVQNIANRTVVTYELDGETYTSTAANVYDRIMGYVNKGADAVEKAKLFNDMLYIYNDDEGIMNKDFAYVVNLDTNVTDKMVKPFADKAREMHATGNVGDVSNMVITEYGVHIMFYAGDVKSANKNMSTLTFADLINTKTQLSSNKSLFDVIYDGIEVNAYNTSASNYINNCYKFINIEKHEGNYKDLFK